MVDSKLVYPKQNQ